MVTRSNKGLSELRMLSLLLRIRGNVVVLPRPSTIQNEGTCRPMKAKASMVLDKHMLMCGWAWRLVAINITFHCGKVPRNSQHSQADIHRLQGPLGTINDGSLCSGLIKIKNVEVLRIDL
mmetsp:Transcript_17811/g.46658  ORF Transcript_17811/g.46658 Transcript_17811/m.46658 type:complete len:120 (-) Transcript_17811:54-413(-)